MEVTVVRGQLGQALQSVSDALASTLRRQRVLERCCGVLDFGHQLLCMVRATILLTMSPATIPRTPPLGF